MSERCQLRGIKDQRGRLNSNVRMDPVKSLKHVGTFVRHYDSLMRMPSLVCLGLSALTVEVRLNRTYPIRYKAGQMRLYSE